jgi:acetoin utilization protein AcuB
MKKSTAMHVFSVRHYMTPAPQCISPDATLAEALRLMQQIGARHLPVVEDGKLVGLVSQRDILAIEARGVGEPSRVPVSSAMQTEVYGVSPDTPLDEVTATLASRKYGCAVVWTGSAVVGIFTTTDAM